MTKLTKEEITDFVMLDLINCKGEEEQIKKISHWLQAEE